jgi:hypothetical protein
VWGRERRVGGSERSKGIISDLDICRFYKDEVIGSLNFIVLQYL